MNTEKENTEVEEEETELSMRDVMEDAIGEVEEAEGSADPIEETLELKAEAKIEEGEHVEKTSKVEKEETQSATDGDTKPTEEDTGKAPQSWSPKLREQFGKLDKGVQAQINKREAEIAKSLNDGAESRKLGETMSKTVEPFRAIMAADGFNDPIQAVQGLMQTAAQLRVGTPQQKAERLAQLIQHYDVDINMLDTVLSGATPQQGQQNELQQLIQKELAPVQQFMSTVQQGQQTAQQQVQQNAQQSLTDFEGKAEFIGDVRNDMADLLDMAAKRGQQMTLQEAYDKACAINPEINAVLQQRNQQEKILGNAQTISQKRQAASSISGRRTGVNNSPDNQSLEATLNQAWDDQSRV